MKYDGVIDSCVSRENSKVLKDNIKVYMLHKSRPKNASKDLRDRLHRAGINSCMWCV